MAEKNIPVWFHQSPTQKVQVGVAAEIDPKTNAQAIEIWPEFESYNLKSVTIGEDPTVVETKAVPAKIEDPKES